MSDSKTTVSSSTSKSSSSTASASSAPAKTQQSTATQATAARRAEGAKAPTPTTTTKTTDTAPTHDKVSAATAEHAHEAKASREHTQQLENLRKNYAAFDAAGSDDHATDNKVTSKDVDEIQNLRKEGKLDDYLRDQNEGISNKELQQKVKQTQSAADYLDDGANRRDLDTANGGESDGTISAQDVDKKLADSRQELPAADQRQLARTQRENVRTFNDNFDRFDNASDGGKLDGNVSRDDIQAVADGKTGASREARQTAQYFLDNPDRLRSLDNAAAEDKTGNGDDKIGQEDVDESLKAANRAVRNDGRTEAQRKAYDGRAARRNVEGVRDLRQNYDTLANASSRDGKIDREDLQSIAGDAHADADTRRSAQYLLDNPGQLDRLDVANDKTGEADGIISREDVRAGGIDAFNQLRRNPDAQRQEKIAQQQKTEWKSPQDAVQNLKDNGDLSTYSDEQLATLNELARRNPKYADQISSATGNYVNRRTNSLDDIPANQGFQMLLNGQVVSNPNLDSLSPGARQTVEDAQDNLKGQVQDGLTSALDKNLEGKEGDDEADQAIDGFGTDLQGLAKRNPALVPYFKDGATSLLQSQDTADKLDDIKHADDSIFEKATNWVGGAISDAGSWVGDKLGDVASLASKAFNPAYLPALGLSAVGIDEPKQFLDDVTKGAIDRPIESLVGGVTGTVGGAIENPTDFAKGLYNLSLAKPLIGLASGKSLSDVVDEQGQTYKAVGDAFIADYKKTFEEDGTVAGVSHVGSDILTTVLTGGASAEVKGVEATEKALEGASKLGKIAGGWELGASTLGHGTEELLAGAKLPSWAKDLGAEAAGSLQEETLSATANGKLSQDYDESVRRAWAGLDQYFAQLNAA